MSDSEDSDSFLSADEGDAAAGNESSDITLSSDSEPDEGGKAGPGDPDSSDITLSSDEDDKCTKPSVKTTAKEAGGTQETAKDVEGTGDAAQAKTGSAKTSGPADIDVDAGQESSSKPGQNVDKPSFSMSDVSSALSSSSLLDLKGPSTKQSASTKLELPNTTDHLVSSELPLKTETAASSPDSNTSAPPDKEATALQASQTHSTDTTPAPAKTITEAKGVHDPHVSAASTHTDSEAVEGWGDFDEDITQLDDLAASPGAKSEPAAPPSEPAVLPSEPAAPPLEPAAPPLEPAAPPSEPAVLPSEPAAPPSEPAVLPSEPATPPSKTAAPPSESAAPPSEPAASPSEPAATPSEPAAPPSEPAASPSEPAAPPSEPAPERRRPERRERRGPLKLGAKKLGAKLTTSAAPPPSETDAAGSGGSQTAAAGSSGSQTAGAGGGPSSQSAPAAAVSSQQEDQDGWGTWETWGSSLLSSAAGVTKTVLETVETGFGAPEPEDLARLTRLERQQERQGQEQERQEPTTQIAPPVRPAEPAATGTSETDASLGLGSWFGGVSRVLGQTSSLVVNTGLDTLEAIGKKTMTVLQEDQLGIHGTISQLGGGQKPSLAQALREARESRGHVVPCSPTADPTLSQPPTFSHMFDRCDGTVHLEALEMLSARCRSRVAAAKGRVDEAVGIVLDMVEELCTPDQLEEREVADFQTELSALVTRLAVPVKPTRLIIAQSSADQWLAAGPGEPAVPRQVLGRAVSAAAEMAAGLAEFLHKLAELQAAGVGGEEPVSAARHLAALTALVAAQAGTLAARFAETLSEQRDERAAAATTDIYLEVSYLQKFCGDSLNLMAPVLQMAALSEKS